MTVETSPTRGASLELKFVGEIGGRFFVPAYQRGYRWGREEVCALLDDVWSSRDERYCLQPVVVKRGADEWELVDGQQRLTTLYLVFLYLHREAAVGAGAAYAIRYETRARSEGYLRDPTAAEAGANIDFFHIYGAYQSIRGWFEGRAGDVAGAMHDRLRTRVQVIWYESVDDGPTLFSRLNVGRIPLTNAELIKAILLRADGGKLAVEVAAQWDAVERDLRDPERWAFLTDAPGASYPTRIELLFDLIAKTAGAPKRPRYDTFDALHERIEGGREAFWNDVLTLHARLLEWHDDRDLHHKVGYLVAEGASLAVLTEAARSMARSEFRRRLEGDIRAHLGLTASRLAALEYEPDYDTCLALLTLMNVEAVRRREHTDERYSFHAHKSRRWSLEHIHAQHAEGLRSDAQRRTWIEAHRKPVAALGVANSGPLLARIDAFVVAPARDAFELLAPEVLAALAPTGDGAHDAVHAITNLALLAADDNSALGNAAFEVKRRQVIELDRRGAFVPPCTRQVFLKYFTDADAQQVHFWSEDDRRAYLSAMLELVRPYLTPEATP